MAYLIWIYGSVIKYAMKKKSSLSVETMEMARRYEKAWHKLFYQQARWLQEIVIAEPFGRHASDLAHEVTIYVETNEDLKD